MGRALITRIHSINGSKYLFTQYENSAFPCARPQISAKRDTILTNLVLKPMKNQKPFPDIRTLMIAQGERERTHLFYWREGLTQHIIFTFFAMQFTNFANCAQSHDCIKWRITKLSVSSTTELWLRLQNSHARIFNSQVPYYRILRTWPRLGISFTHGRCLIAHGFKPFWRHKLFHSLLLGALGPGHHEFLLKPGWHDTICWQTGWWRKHGYNGCPIYEWRHYSKWMTEIKWNHTDINVWGLSSWPFWKLHWDVL